MKIGGIITYILVIVLISIITLLAVLNVDAAQKKPGFTELYFVGNLPKTIKLYETYKFSFAIHNFENKLTTYHYAMFLNSDKIDQGSISIKKDHIAIIDKDFVLGHHITAASGATGIPISVRLLGKDQEIHFWLDVEETYPEEEDDI